MNRRRTPSRRTRVWLAAAVSVAVAGGAAILADAQAATHQAATHHPYGPGPAAPPTAPPAAGKLLWSAAPAKGLKAFASVQCATDTFTAVADKRLGEVWQVVQPAHLERCEGLGPDVTLKSSYYLGWSSKFDITDGMSRYLFQLKCDPSTGTANHPVVLEDVNGRIELEDWTPKHTSVVLWSTPAVNDKWSSYALRISEGRTDGTIQFWYDGVEQKLSNGSDTYTGTTYDGTVDYLKWGLYHPSKGSATQWLTTPRMGTTLASVAQ